MLYSTALWLLLIILGLIVVFYCICILCDEHLVPTIEVFIEQFKIPEEVAAVTLVAFGSACPEIVLNSIGAMENKSSLSLPACLGSGIIAFGLIPSLCLLCNEQATMELKSWPVFRESFFYCCALLLFLRSFSDKSISLGEAALLVSVYLIYVSLVIGLYMFDSGDRPGILTTRPVTRSGEYAEVDAAEDGDAVEQALLLGSSAVRREFEASEYDDGRNAETGQSSTDADGGGTFQFDGHSSNAYRYLLPYCNRSVIARVAVPVLGALGRTHRALDSAIGQPLHHLLNMLVPALRPSMTNSSCSVWCGNKYSGGVQSPRSGGRASPRVVHPPPVSLPRALLVFAVCIGAVGLFASFIISLCEGVTAILGINSGTIGATMVALGSEIPDTVQSVTLSRNGYNEAAMSGAIGSQVINLSLGVGMPLLVLCLNSPTHSVELSTESSNSLYILSSLLLVVIVCHNCVILPTQKLYELFVLRFFGGYSTVLNQGSEFVKEVQNASFSKAGAWCLLLSFVAAFVTFVTVNEKMV